MAYSNINQQAASHQENGAQANGMKKTIFLAHCVPVEEGLAALESASVLRRFGVHLVVFFNERNLDGYLREPIDEQRYQKRKLT